jgi:hypothetical protein
MLAVLGKVHQTKQQQQNIRVLVCRIAVVRLVVLVMLIISSFLSVLCLIVCGGKKTASKQASKQMCCGFEAKRRDNVRRGCINICLSE